MIFLNISQVQKNPQLEAWGLFCYNTSFWACFSFFILTMFLIITLVTAYAGTANKAPSKPMVNPPSQKVFRNL